jgi:hypothetical protein
VNDRHRKLVIVCSPKLLYTRLMKLNDLPDDIRLLVVRLPYRVGFYVSASDKTGGEESDAAEMAALEGIVTFYVEDFCKSEFAQAVMLETIQRKAEWAGWQEKIEIVPEEIRKVLDFLVDKLDGKELTAFKNNLLEIAIAVAQAYREFDVSQPLTERVQVYLSILIARIKALIKGQEIQSHDALLNISRDEKMAINLLADALGVEYRIG